MNPSPFFYLQQEAQAAGVSLTGTDPLHVSIETEDVEDPVCVHLSRVEPVGHDHRRVCVGAVLPGRRRRGPVARPVAPPPAAPQGGAHAAALVRRGPVALLVAMVTASCRKRTQLTLIAVSVRG